MRRPDITDPSFTLHLERLALAAGRTIMDIFRAGCSVEEKADASPVTEADRQAEILILEGLHELTPDIPIVAEEEASAGRVPDVLGDLFFLVDPLDGTREFVKQREDFTINIALVRGGRPIQGVVYAPARKALYSTGSKGAQAAQVSGDHVIADRRAIAARSLADPPVIVASRSHRTLETDAFIARHPGAEIVSVGSSLKFCLLAEGKADLYPRLGRTMEWDTAAGDAILRAAGGRMATATGEAFVYGKRDQADDADFANPHFIAEGAAAR